MNDLFKVSWVRMATMTILIAGVLVGSFWIFGGRTYIIRLIPTQNWVRFDVPPAPLSIETDFKISTDNVTVCNRSADSWDGILVRINDTYVAKISSLRRGDCKAIPFEDFAMPSWKRLPGYRNMNVYRIEVLTSGPRGGYVNRQFPSNSGVVRNNSFGLLS